MKFTYKYSLISFFLSFSLSLSLFPLSLSLSLSLFRRSLHPSFPTDRPDAQGAVPWRDAVRDQDHVGDPRRRRPRRVLPAAGRDAEVGQVRPFSCQKRGGSRTVTDSVVCVAHLFRARDRPEYPTCNDPESSLRPCSRSVPEAYT